MGQRICPRFADVRLVASLMRDYPEGLSPGGVEAVRAHFAECDECRTRWDAALIEELIRD